jgi:hypothetical protein
MLGGASDYTRCPDCGTSVGHEILVAELHRCDARHREDHVSELLVVETEVFEWEWADYLDSPRGRFEVFYAARTRRA